MLSFFLGQSQGQVIGPAVQVGDDVSPGQALGKIGDESYRPSPVAGVVRAVRECPDIQAGPGGIAVLIEPASEPAAPVFAPLDADSAAVEEVIARWQAAAIRLGNHQRSLLVDALSGIASLVVLASDQEPGVRVAASLLAERSDDARRAVALLARVSGAQKLWVGAAATQSEAAGRLCPSSATGLLTLPARYPHTLAPMVAARTGDAQALVVSLETALAAYDAVVHGRLQEHKLLTLVNSRGATIENLSVAMGTRLSDLVAACDLRLHSGDKLVAGGLMGGTSQYSLEAAVDEGVDALVHVPGEEVVPFTDEPCINCGACIDVCPLRLQVQNIGRYSEFGKFSEARAYGLDACIECGLCASVCTARRPLLQLIRMAKRELAQQAAADEAVREASGGD